MGKPGIPCIQLLALVLMFLAYESTATVIKYLPGFEGPLPFYLETGYVGVGVAEEVQLFYYFVKSESNPEEDPLLLWITGGPGCSALSGLTLENGPFTFNEWEYSGTLPKLSLKPNSWTKLSSIIFLDLPVGTGFSYTRNDSVLQSTDLMQVSQAEEFLRREDPLLLWLTGGPGCSSLTALLFEIGPVSFQVVEYNGSLPTLILNPNSWSKVSSIIFVDLPVGAGFSYAAAEPGYRSSDSIQSSQAAQFIRKWLRKNAEFQSNPLYIGGDSYAGIPIPIAVQLISLGNEMGIKPIVNLKGYILGNPVTDSHFDDNAQIPTAHGLALISDELYQSLETSCGGEYHIVNPTNYRCAINLASFYQIVLELYMENILYPMCGLATPKPTEISANRRFLWDIYQHQSLQALKFPKFGCPTYPHLLSYYWADNEAVRIALHVRKDTVKRWIRCNRRSDYVYDVRSSFKTHMYLSTKGFRSLIYSGDHDLVVPSMGTQDWIRALNYSIVEDWRSWHVDGQVAGYTRAYSNGMRFATVKGAGHIAPEYKQLECSAMFKRWINEEPI
ncbi:Serine carboxypeptidase-like 19 [Linum perenne]